MTVKVLTNIGLRSRRSDPERCLTVIIPASLQRTLREYAVIHETKIYAVVVAAITEKLAREGS